MPETEMKYVAKFSLDSSGLTQGLTGAAISFDAVSMAAQTGLASAQKAFDATIGKALEFADTMKKASDVTGSSVENLQRLKAAGIATGVTFDSITTTLRMFSQRISDAGSGGIELRDRLHEIGVAVKDGNGQWRDASEVFMDVNKQLNAMTNTYDRNNLAMATYGRSWSQIAPMIKEATKAEIAYNNANPFSEEATERAHDLGIELDKINAKWSRMGTTIGMEATPAYRDFVNYFTTGVEVISNGVDKIRTERAKMVNDAEEMMLKQMSANQKPMLNLGSRPGDSFGLGVKKETEERKQLNDQYSALIMNYTEMGQLQHDFSSTQKDLNTVTEEFNRLLKNGAQKELDAAGEKVLEVTAKYQGLRSAISDLSKTEAEAQGKTALTGSTNPYLDTGAIENQALMSPQEREKFIAGLSWVGTTGGPSDWLYKGMGGYQSQAGVGATGEDRVRHLLATSAGQSSNYDDLIRMMAGTGGIGYQNEIGYRTNRELMGMGESNFTQEQFRQMQDPNLVAKDRAWRGDTSNVNITMYNSGTASPEEIATATANAISRALASQVRT